MSLPIIGIERSFIKRETNQIVGERGRALILLHYYFETKRLEMHLGSFYVVHFTELAHAQAYLKANLHIFEIFKIYMNK